jgi:hypothetical protein
MVNWFFDEIQDSSMEERNYFQWMVLGQLQKNKFGLLSHTVHENVLEVNQRSDTCKLYTW